MTLSETIANIKSNVADIGCKSLYGKTIQEVIDDMMVQVDSPISFHEFLQIAKRLNAFDILETWDSRTFDEYVRFFGPMTAEGAANLCSFIEAVSREEEIAGEYFSRR